MSQLLINKAAVRRFALDTLKAERPHLAEKFTRVGSEFFDAVESSVRNTIRGRIATQPSTGKTLR